MKPPAPPPPAPALPVEQPRLPLDERIRLAEQRLISREQRLARAVSAWPGQIRSAVRPSRLMVPLLGLLVTAVTAGWLWKRWQARRPDARVLGRQAPASTVARGSEPSPVAWASVLALAMPLLPARMRLHIKPATASTWLALGVPLLQRLLVGQVQAPLAVAPTFDINRYVGTWYEVARLTTPLDGPCDSQPMLRYALLSDGQLEVLHRCRRRNGRWRNTQGLAHRAPGAAAARWRMSLWPRLLRRLPLAWADYWVLDVDEDYKTALVGTRDRRGLWLLSRRPHMPAQRLQVLLDRARRDGFDVERLRFNV